MINVLDQIHGWTAGCTCRRWVGVAKNQEGLRRKHDEHVREQESKR